MSKKSDFKHAVKEPDAFVSSSHILLHWIERHAVSVGAIVALGTALGLSYVSYTYLADRTEQKAADSLFKAESELKKAESKIREERAKRMQELAGLSKDKKTDVKPDSVRPIDFAKDFGPLVTNMKTELKKVGDTRAGLVSALNLSYFLLQQKQYGEALDVMKTPSYKPSSKDLLGGLWRMHYGLVLLENGKPDEAIQVYSDITSQEDLKAFRAEALLKMGIAYELKGEGQKAKDAYEKIGREFPNTESANSAAQYLRLMDIKAQKG